jgi:hypothetical protein
LTKDKALAKKWVEATPNIEDMMKRQCKSPEELMEVLENFVATLGVPAATGRTKELGSDYTETRTGKPQTSQLEDKLGDAFSGAF